MASYVALKPKGPDKAPDEQAVAGPSTMRVTQPSYTPTASSPSLDATTAGMVAALKGDIDPGDKTKTKSRPLVHPEIDPENSRTIRIRETYVYKKLGLLSLVVMGLTHYILGVILGDLLKHIFADQFILGDVDDQGNPTEDAKAKMRNASVFIRPFAYSEVLEAKEIVSRLLTPLNSLGVDVTLGAILARQLRARAGAPGNTPTTAEAFAYGFSAVLSGMVYEARKVRDTLMGRKPGRYREGEAPTSTFETDGNLKYDPNMGPAAYFASLYAKYPSLFVMWAVLSGLAKAPAMIYKMVGKVDSKYPGLTAIILDSVAAYINSAVLELTPAAPSRFTPTEDVMSGSWSRMCAAIRRLGPNLSIILDDIAYVVAHIPAYLYDSSFPVDRFPEMESLAKTYQFALMKGATPSLVYTDSDSIRVLQDKLKNVLSFLKTNRLFIEQVNVDTALRHYTVRTFKNTPGEAGEKKKVAYRLVHLGLDPMRLINNTTAGFAAAIEVNQGIGNGALIKGAPSFIVKDVTQECASGVHRYWQALKSVIMFHSPGFSLTRIKLAVKKLRAGARLTVLLDPHDVHALACFTCPITVSGSWQARLGVPLQDSAFQFNGSVIQDLDVKTIPATYMAGVVSTPNCYSAIFCITPDMTGALSAADFSSIAELAAADGGKQFHFIDYGRSSDDVVTEEVKRYHSGGERAVRMGGLVNYELHTYDTETGAMKTVSATRPFKRLFEIDLGFSRTIVISPVMKRYMELLVALFDICFELTRAKYSSDLVMFWIPGSTRWSVANRKKDGTARLEAAQSDTFGFNGQRNEGALEYKDSLRVVGLGLALVEGEMFERYRAVVSTGIDLYNTPHADDVMLPTTGDRGDFFVYYDPSNPKSVTPHIRNVLGMSEVFFRYTGSIIVADKLRRMMDDTTLMDVLTEHVQMKAGGESDVLMSIIYDGEVAEEDG